MIARFVAVLLSVLFALSLSELALRLLTREEQLYMTTDDAYWKANLAHAIEADHGPAKDIQPDPLLGWRMKPDYRDGNVRHNSRGFRDEREFDQPAPGQRILVIGASMAYGLGVDAAQTMPARLEASTGAQTINAGVNAYGADQALLLWEQEGRPLRPDVVVFVYHVDDFYRSGLTIRDLPKPYFVRDDGGFRLEGVPVPSAESLVASGALDRKTHFRIQQAFEWLYRKASHKLGIEDPARLESLESLNAFLLRRLRDSVTEAGGRLVVVVTGHCADGVDDYAVSERAIDEACQKLDIDFLDLAAAMREGNYASYFGDNCHWSQAGHEFAAKRIESVLGIAH